MPSRISSGTFSEVLLRTFSVGFYRSSSRKVCQKFSWYWPQNEGSTMILVDLFVWILPHSFSRHVIRVSPVIFPTGIRGISHEISSVVFRRASHWGIYPRIYFPEFSIRGSSGSLSLYRSPFFYRYFSQRYSRNFRKRSSRGLFQKCYQNVPKISSWKNSLGVFFFRILPALFNDFTRYFLRVICSSSGWCSSFSYIEISFWFFFSCFWKISCGDPPTSS